MMFEEKLRKKIFLSCKVDDCDEKFIIIDED